MKKLFTFIAIAALAVACCNKQPAALSVEKFFENPSALLEKETTVTGTVMAMVCPQTGGFVIGTEAQQLMVIPPAEAKTCKKGCIGKEVTIKGVVKDYRVTEDFLTQFEENVESIECPEMKESHLQKAAEFRATFEAEGEYSIYYIEASEITCEKDTCKEKKSGCGEKKEGCGDKKEGCCKDKEAKSGCGDKKEGCCKDKKEGDNKEAKEGCGKTCDKPCGKKKTEGCDEKK